MGADPGTGRIVGGRYELAGVLGRGGMGVVWLANDRVLGREVALKEVTFGGNLSDEDRRVLRERTMREARVAARLDHPCVTTVFDVIEDDGKPWVVMERVASRSLQEIVESNGPLPPAAVARIGLDVLAGLEAAHAAGVVHRDVKPANILVNSEGRACLTDFGIATSTGDSSLTAAGAFLGSPSYVAPERAQGEAPGPSVDLWSLGASLYTAVEGRLAFDREDSMATLLAVLSEPPAPMVRAGALEPVLLAMLTKDPAGRPGPQQLHDDLHAVLDASPPTPGAPQDVLADRGAPVGAMRTDRVERIDVEDLRALASASKALIGSVAREARDRSRALTDRRQVQDGVLPQRRQRAKDVGRRGEADHRTAQAAPRRRRFKRRWVVVPVVVFLLVGLLVLVGVAALLTVVFHVI